VVPPLLIIIIAAASAPGESSYGGPDRRRAASTSSSGRWWRSAVLGTLNIGAFFALLFVSAYRLPGGVAAVLGAAGPLLVAGLSVVLLGERLTARRLLAGALTAAGVALTAETGLDPVGVLAGVAGTASMSLGVVLTKRWRRPTSVLTMTGWQLSAGGLLLLPLALSVEGCRRR